MPQPIVKWAGGKRQLLAEIESRMPKVYGNYFEPFFGGGALFLDQISVAGRNYYVNDINKDLIRVYETVRDYPDQLIQKLESIDSAMPKSKDEAKAYYVLQRKNLNKFLVSKESLCINDAIYASALFIFVNKHCFNGLYRLNSKGEFNVPWNGSYAKSFDKENFYAVSLYMQHAIIQNLDFEDALKLVSKDDFVFFDSPYAPLTNTSFEKYTADGFDESEQIRLAGVYRKLDSKGAHLIATNNDTELIRDLYSQFKIETVSVRRSINRKGDARQGTEIIITNE